MSGGLASSFDSAAVAQSPAGIPVSGEASEQMTESEEQCLSVPDMTVKVKRHLTVTVAWIDALGQPHRERFEDWPSIVIQHELDQLIGRTLYDRASRLKRSRYLKARKKAPRTRPM